MSKQAGLSVAIGLVGVGIILHALPKLGVGPAAAVAAASPIASTSSLGDAKPSIVWYGSSSVSIPANGGFGTEANIRALVFRAWSDGTLEMKRVMPIGVGICANWCGGVDPPGCSNPTCASQWIVIGSPDEGLAAIADSNSDQVVDGADLANLLAAWGPAPRSPIPPSDCPLVLLNP